MAACLRAPRDIQLYMLSWAKDPEAIGYLRTCKSLKRFHCLYEHKNWVHPLFASYHAISKIRKLTLSFTYASIANLYPHVTHLKLNRQGYKLLDCLPARWKLVYLHLQGLCNEPLPDLPTSLTYLQLPEDFNQPLGKWVPPSLKTLIFGNEFNQPVDGLLPKTVTYLEFGDVFNQSVNELPENLLHVFFGCNFNQHLHKLPQFLESLYLFGIFGQDLDHLPKSLQRVRVSKGYLRVIPKDVPINDDRQVWDLIKREKENCA